MPTEQVNERIDQRPIGIPKATDWGLYRDMDNSQTKRFSMALVLDSPANNIEWISDNDPGYATDDIVTYGGNIYQSLIDDNLNIIPGSDVDSWELLTRGINWARWAAGTFIEADVIVIRAIDGEDHLVQLVDAARPYVSSDFDTEYAAGDWISITQNIINKAATDAAGTIQLDMNYLKERNFNLVAVVTEAKTWSILKGTNLKKLTVTFEIDAGLDAHIFPNTFKLYTLAGLYDSATFTWTPTDAGKYELEIYYNGTIHSAKLFGPFN